MSNYAKALKEEVTRIARKEVRQEIATLKKNAIHHRTEIATLKRKVSQLEKETSALRKAVHAQSPQLAQPEVTNKRITAKGFISLRKRLGLSAEIMGKLLGVTSGAVYNYEKGVRPAALQLVRIDALRTMGKKAVAELLAAANP